MYYEINKTRNLTLEQQCAHQWGSSDDEFAAALVHAIALATIPGTKLNMYTTWECIFVKLSTAIALDKFQQRCRRMIFLY